MLGVKIISIKDHLSGPLRKLYAHSVYKSLADGLMGVFEPLFFLALLGKVEWVVIYYLVEAVVILFLYPFLTRRLLRYDLKWLMMGATVFAIVYNVGLIGLDKYGVKGWWLGTMIGVMVVYKIMYWVPYHTEFAAFTAKAYRGRELSALQSAVALLGIGLPAIAGLVVVKFGFIALFLLVVGLHILSVGPLWGIPKKKEIFSYSYRECWKQLFHRRNLHTTLAYFADGFQARAGCLVWPIFIFLILKGEYLSVGIVSSLIVFMTVVIRIVMGDLSDHSDKHRLIKAMSILYSLGWVFKIFVETATQIFFVGVYHGFAEAAWRTPFDTLMYDEVAKRGHYADEYTVLREMALWLGRIFVLIITLVVLTVAGVNWVFLIASLMALMVNFL